MISSLLVTIDGESPPTNKPFNVLEGEHIVQCTAETFDPTKLDIQLFLGDQPQNITAKFHEKDMNTAFSTNGRYR